MRRSASLRRDHPCTLCYSPWPSDQALLLAKLKRALGTDFNYNKPVWKISANGLIVVFIHFLKDLLNSNNPFGCTVTLTKFSIKTEKIFLKLHLSNFRLTQYWCTKHKYGNCSCIWYLERRIKIVLPLFILVESLTKITYSPKSASPRFQLLVTAMLQFARIKTQIAFSSLWNHYPGKIHNSLKWHDVRYI